MKAGNANWRDKLHTVSLSVGEEMEVAAWFKDNTMIAWVCLEELLDNSWSVRITPPGSGDDYWASATCRQSKSDVEGHTFSVRYPDVEGVMFLLYYVVTVMLERGDHDIFSEISSKDWMKINS